jgi:glutaminyl-tRNA synthetase
VAKFNGTLPLDLMQHCLREDLNKRAPRIMTVLKPLKLVIDNYPDGQVEQLEAVNNPEDESAGTRQVPFGKTLYIEATDFMEDPPKKFFRLAPGREVRLRYAYFVTCTDVVKDDAGNITEIHCTYDPATRGGDSPDGRKVKGTIHWVSADHAVPAEVRLYDHLFNREDPNDTDSEEQTYLDNLNPESLEILDGCMIEPSWRDAKGPDWSDGIHRVQFERHGYFCLDPDSGDGTGPAEKLVWNRTVTLRDTWAKIAKKQ